MVKLGNGFPPVYILEDGDPIPTDMFCYVMAANGNFIVKNMNLIRAVVPIDKIPVESPLKTVESNIELNLPKIPAEIAYQAAAFFKAVYKKYRTESAVLICMDEEQNFSLFVPTQEVSGAAVHYSFEVTDTTRRRVIGTIHSHADFNAFHSGTDVGDEKNLDGIHITFGHVNGDNYSLACSLVANEHRQKCNPLDYMEGIVVVSGTENNTDLRTEEAHNGVRIIRIKEKPSQYTAKRDAEPRYNLLCEELPEVPEDWFNKVSHGRAVTTTGQHGNYLGGYLGGYFGGYFGNDFGDYYSNGNLLLLNDKRASIINGQPTNSPKSKSDDFFMDSASLRRSLQEEQSEVQRESGKNNQEGTETAAEQEKVQSAVIPEDFPGESIHTINKLTTYIAENLGSPTAVQEGFELALSDHCTSCPFFNLLFSIGSDEEIVQEFLETLAHNNAKNPEALLRISECAEHLGVVFKSHIGIVDIDREFEGIQEM